MSGGYGRRRGRAPGAKGCDAGSGFTSNLDRDRGLQEGHGMAVQVGVFVRERLNFDYHVSFSKDEMAKGKVYCNYSMTEFPSEEAPGATVSYQNRAGEVFHTYSAYARELDVLLTAYIYLDLTPKGRDGEALAYSMAWIRHHDRCGDERNVDGKRLSVTQASSDGPCCSEGTAAVSIQLQTVGEFREEAAITKRVLERVPAAKLSWKPHPKSMSLGQLALHVANIPGSLAKLAQ